MIRSASLATMTLIVTLFSLGCAREAASRLPWPAQVVSIEGFSAAGTEQVLAAIKNMNQKMGKEAVSQSEGEGFKIQIRMVTPNEGTKTRAGFATVYSDLCEVEISSALFESGSPDYLEPVVWHELGHCAGLSHDPSPGEVMYKTTAPNGSYSSDSLMKFFDAVKASAGL